MTRSHDRIAFSLDEIAELYGLSVSDIRRRCADNTVAWFSFRARFASGRQRLSRRLILEGDHQELSTDGHKHTPGGGLRTIDGLFRGQELVTTRELAQVLGVNRRSVYRMFQDGLLEGEMIGRSWVTSAEAVREWMRANRYPTRWEVR